MASPLFHPPAAAGITTPAIQAALLKEIGKQLPGVPVGEPLAVGQTVPARIGSDPETGKPTLIVGGVRIQAQLPEGVTAGQLLRLQVKENSPERLLFQIVKDPPTGGAAANGTSASAAAVATSAAAAVDDAAPQQAAQSLSPAQQAAATSIPFAVIPMPGGAQARLWLDPDGESEEAEASVRAARPRTLVIRYDSPILGRTDVVLRLEPGKLDASVLAPAGDPLELIRSTVPDLRLALAAAVDRPVALTTGGRGVEELDIRV